jgi:hypothetical protein
MIMNERPEVQGNDRTSKDNRKEDVRNLERKLTNRCIEPHANEAQIRRYFTNRLARMKIVGTTRTPTDQTVDWIPIESQLKPGHTIAAPPPLGYKLPPPGGERIDRIVQFELEDPKVARGPAGTVPVLRKNLDHIGFNQSLRKLLGKYSMSRHEFPVEGRMKPAPSVDGPHRYASTIQRILCFGGEGVLSAFDPYCENPDDFSLMQLALVNADSGKMQTVEAGWQERKDSYGDWFPHLFLYYTTNGYEQDDDDLGGYNQDVDGWVQVDRAIYPGAISSPNSRRGGDQYGMQIKFQLHRGNWWFMCNGKWIGYYPASLFMGNQSVFSTLGDHAGIISFYGEVHDSNDVPGKTRSDMGSGYWPEYGWLWAAYQRNLKVQTDRAGAMSNYDAVGWATDPDMYDLESHMNSGTSWESYFWLGGPGA